MKTKLLITTIIYGLFVATPFVSADESFIAPLVRESLLLAAAKGNNTIVVGERGHILVNEKDKPQSIEAFRQVAAPTKVTLTDVFSIDDLAWAVGHDATILKSSDGGLTWSLIKSEPELDRPLLSVYFFDKQEGIAIGAYGLFYRSLDGGDTWTQERHPSVLSDDDNEYLDSIKDDEAFYLEELSFISPHLNTLSFFNDILYIAGEAGLVAKSEDRGQSWTRVDLDYQGSFFDLSKFQQDNALAAGLRGNMFVIGEEEQRVIPACITTSINALIRTEDKIFALGNNGVLLAIDIDLLSSDDTQAPNNEDCEAHVAVSQIETDFSEAIVSGIITKEGLIAMTAGGLKMVAIEE